MRSTLVLVLLLLAAFAAAATAKAPGSTVQELCSQTQNATLCVSSTKPFLPSCGSGGATASSLLRAETQALRSKMKKVIARLTELVANPPKLDSSAGGPGAQDMFNKALENCRGEVADDAMEALGKGSDAMRSLDTQEYISQLSSITSYVSSCSTDLEDIPATYWPESDLQEVIDMAGNCLSLMKIVGSLKEAK